MAKQSIEYIKSKFESGDQPTEQDFIDLIDTLNDSADNINGFVLVSQTVTGDGIYTTPQSAISAGHNNLYVDSGTYPFTIASGGIVELGNNTSIRAISSDVIFEWDSVDYMFGFNNAVIPTGGTSDGYLYIIPIGSTISNENWDSDTITTSNPEDDLTTIFTVGENWAFDYEGILRQLGLYKVIEVGTSYVMFDRSLPINNGEILTTPMTIYRIMPSNVTVLIDGITIKPVSGGFVNSNAIFNNRGTNLQYIYYDKFTISNCDLHIARDGITRGNFLTSSDNTRDISVIHSKIKSDFNGSFNYQGWGYYGGYFYDCYLENCSINDWKGYGISNIHNCTLNSCEINPMEFQTTELNYPFNLKNHNLSFFTNNKLINCTSSYEFPITKDIINGDIITDTFTFSQNAITNFEGTQGGLTDVNGNYKEFNPKIDRVTYGAENINYIIDKNDDGILHIICPDDFNNYVYLPNPLDENEHQRPEFHDGKTYKIMMGVHDEYGIDFDCQYYIMFPNSSAPNCQPHPTINDYVGEVDTFSVISYGTWAGEDGTYEHVPTIAAGGGNRADFTVTFRVVEGDIVAGSVLPYWRGKNYTADEGDGVITVDHADATGFTLQIDSVRDVPMNCYLVQNNADTPYFEFMYTRTGNIRTGTSHGNKQTYPPEKAYSWAVVNTNKGFQEAQQLAGLDAIVSDQFRFNQVNQDDNPDSDNTYELFKPIGDSKRWSAIGHFQTIDQAIKAGKRNIGLMVGEMNNRGGVDYTITEPIVLSGRDDEFSIKGFSRTGARVNLHVDIPLLNGVTKQDAITFNYSHQPTETPTSLLTGDSWSYNSTTHTVTDGEGAILSAVLTAGDKIIFSQGYSTVRRLGEFTVASVGEGTVTFVENLPIKNGTHITIENWKKIPNYIVNGGGLSLYFDNIKVTTTSNIDDFFNFDDRDIFKRFELNNCEFDISANDYTYDYLEYYNAKSAVSRNCVFKSRSESVDYLYLNLTFENCEFNNFNVLTDFMGEFNNCIFNDCNINNQYFSTTRKTWVLDGAYVKFTNNYLKNCVWETVLTDNYYNPMWNDIVNCAGTVGEAIHTDSGFKVKFSDNLFVKDMVHAQRLNLEPTEQNNNNPTIDFRGFEDQSSLPTFRMREPETSSNNEVLTIRPKGALQFTNYSNDTAARFSQQTSKSGNKDILHLEMGVYGTNSNIIRSWPLSAGWQGNYLLFQDYISQPVFTVNYKGAITGSSMVLNDTGSEQDILKIIADNTEGDSAIDIEIRNGSISNGIKIDSDRADNKALSVFYFDGEGSYEKAWINHFGDAEFKNVTCNGSLVAAEPWIVVLTQAEPPSINAETNKKYMIDTTLSNQGFTFPASGTLIVGDTITIVDMKGTFNTNNIIIDIQLFEGVFTSKSLTVNNSITQFVWTGIAYGWKELTLG